MDPVNNLKLPDFDLFLVLGMLFTIHGFLLRSKSKIFQYARLLPYLLSILRIRATYELSLFIYGMKGIENIFTFDMRLSIALKFTGLLVLQCSRASFQPPQS